MKIPYLALGILLALPCVALADDAAKVEAQKKIDDAKVKACESARTFLAARAATCPDEAGTAKAITCSAAETDRVLALQKTCLERTGDASAPLPCKVLTDDGKALAELEPMDGTACRAKAKETALAKLCTPENKGKAVKYRVQRGDRTALPGFTMCK